MIARKLFDLMSKEDQAWALREGIVEPDLAVDPVKVRKHLLRREKDQQNQFLSWMNLHDVYQITPAGDRASTIRPGHPDHTLFHYGARTQLIEMKREEGVLSPVQQLRIAELQDRGFDVRVCRSSAEAMAAAKEYL